MFRFIALVVCFRPINVAQPRHGATVELVVAHGLVILRINVQINSPRELCATIAGLLYLCVVRVVAQVVITILGGLTWYKDKIPS